MENNEPNGTGKTTTTTSGRDKSPWKWSRSHVYGGVIIAIVTGLIILGTVTNSNRSTGEQKPSLVLPIGGMRRRYLSNDASGAVLWAEGERLLAQQDRTMSYTFYSTAPIYQSQCDEVKVAISQGCMVSSECTPRDVLRRVQAIAAHNHKCNVTVLFSGHTIKADHYTLLATAPATMTSLYAVQLQYTVDTCGGDKCVEEGTSGLVVSSADNMYLDSLQGTPGNLTHSNLLTLAYPDRDLFGGTISQLWRTQIVRKEMVGGFHEPVQRYVTERVVWPDPQISTNVQAEGNAFLNRRDQPLSIEITLQRAASRMFISHSPQVHNYKTLFQAFVKFVVFSIAIVPVAFKVNKMIESTGETFGVHWHIATEHGRRVVRAGLVLSLCLVCIAVGWIDRLENNAVVALSSYVAGMLFAFALEYGGAELLYQQLCSLNGKLKRLLRAAGGKFEEWRTKKDDKPVGVNHERREPLLDRSSHDQTIFHDDKKAPEKERNLFDQWWVKLMPVVPVLFALAGVIVVAITITATVGWILLGGGLGMLWAPFWKMVAIVRK